MIKKKTIIAALATSALGLLSVAPAAMSEDAKSIELPGDQAYPESISAASDGTIYVSSLASGGIIRVAPGSAKGEVWIKPGAFDTRSTFGVLVDEATKTLWVCSNDASGIGVPGPSSVPGSYVKGFDLGTGEGKFSAKLPGEHTLCNDMAIGPDGSLFVTNSLAPQILRLKPGSKELEVWLEDSQFAPPKDGAGLDGIAFGGDGNLYVNMFTKGDFFRSRCFERCCRESGEAQDIASAVLPRCATSSERPNLHHGGRRRHSRSRHDFRRRGILRHRQGWT